MTEEEILFKVKQFYDDAISGSVSKKERMRKAENFKIGIQWDESVVEANRAKGKFSLTIPIIKPQIKQIAGYEIQNPKDLSVLNLREGSATGAKILTALAKQALDSEHVRFEKSLVFEAGLTTGEGDIGVFIDRSEDPRHGNLIITKLNEFEVYWDPYCNAYDPNDKISGAKYVIWEPWIDKELVEAEYPEKKALLQVSGSGSTAGVMGSVETFIDWITSLPTKAIGYFTGRSKEDVDTQEKYRYPVNHTWWFEPKKCVFLYDATKSELDAVLCVKSEDIKKARQKAEAEPEVFSTVEVVRPVMHHTIRVRNVLLDDRIDELNGVTMFPIGRFNPAYDNGYSAGTSEDLIGTQEEINWAHSQQLNIIKNLANSGWKIARDTGDYAQWLEEHGGEDGIVLDESRGGGKVEKLQPNTPSAGFHFITEQAIEHSKLISNIRTEDPSFDLKNMSGRAILAKQQNALTGKAPEFLKWDYSMTILGNLIVEIIRNNDIYSVDEIREIVDEKALIDKNILDDARKLVIEQLGKAGINIPQERDNIDMLQIQNLPPALQQAAMVQNQKDAYLSQKIMAKIDDLARPIAEAMLLEEIKKLRKGRYNTKVTLSPMAATLRLAKAAEIFELNNTLLKSGQLPLSRRTLIEATDIDKKEEIIEEGERQMAQLAKAK